MRKFLLEFENFEGRKGAMTVHVASEKGLLNELHDLAKSQRCGVVDVYEIVQQSSYVFSGSKLLRNR